MSNPPNPTPIYRIVHLKNLRTFLSRGALYSPNTEPADGAKLRTIHDENVQAGRHVKQIGCGPGGTCHDYVPFYFGVRSVMLFQLKTGWVKGYDEGQDPIIYLKSTVQAATQKDLAYVFSDGHGLAAFTTWIADLARLNEVDWSMVNQKYWKDTPDDNDRKRRKQAEFLIRDKVPWDMIQEVGVFNLAACRAVKKVFEEFPNLAVSTNVRPEWYY